MKADMIHDKARVWTVSIGPDGKLSAELDPKRLAALFSHPKRLAA